MPGAPLRVDGDTPATIRLAAGGQAANVAAWARSLGARSRLICARGTGPASDIAVAELRRRGVEILGPVVDGGGAVVVSTREPDGARTMASDAGVAGALRPEAIDPAWVRDADVVHVSGYCLVREPAAAAAIAAAGWARRTTLDLASAHDVELFGASRFADLAARLRAEVVFATDAERAAVPGLRAPRWVVKHGPDGATFPEGHRPVAPGPVVDATGAGDALAAGYLVGGPEAAMEAAARCVGALGAMPG